MRARGYSTLGCRRAFSTLGFAGTAVALLSVPACARAGGAPLATVAFSLALGAIALHPSGAATMCRGCHHVCYSSLCTCMYTWL